MKSYGLLAEFRTADDLVAAARCAYAAGYLGIEAYSPFPVDGLTEALGKDRRAWTVPLWTLLGGIAGGASGYFMQWYSAVISYPLNIGGRPLHSWPSFIPATFELTVLGAAFAGVIAMFVANGLPRLHHPLFAVRDFESATRHRFFLCLRASDPVFDAERTRAFLRRLDPLRVEDVPFVERQAQP